MTIIFVTKSIRFVPDQPARESFDKQKIRLQEKMSGLKYFDELNGNHCKSSLFKLDKSEDCSDMDPIDTRNVNFNS